MKRHFHPVDLFGYVGALCVIVALLLVSFEIVGPRDIPYQILNLLGGVGICITAFFHQDYPSGVLNVIFGGVALIALITIIIF